MKKLFKLLFVVATIIAIVWLGIANARKAREIENLEAIKRQYELVYLPSIGVNPSDILITQPSATPKPSEPSKENCSSCEELECKLDDANNTIQVLEYSLNTANNRIEELEAELEDSYVNHEKEENVQDNTENVENLEAELETTKAELDAAEEKIKELEEELSEAEEEVKKLEDKIEKLSEEDSDDSTEVKNLKSDLKDAKEEIEELEEDLAALKKENKTLKSDNDDLKEKNKTLKSDNDDLKEENKTLKTEKEEFRSYWNDAEILAAEYGMELTTVKERNSELEKLLTEATGKVTELEKQLNSLEQWIGAEFDEETYLTVKFPEDGHYYMTTNKVTFYYDPTCTQKIDFDYWNHSFRSSKIDYDYAENGLSVYVLRMDNGMLVYCPQSKDYPYLVTVDEFWERIDEWEWLLNEY